MDIKRLLNKKGWTGRELGILEVTNMAVLFRQAIEGREQQPLVEQAQLHKMINSITDRQQGLVYNGYISIHEWISLHYNIAQTHLQQAQLRYRELLGYVTEATLAEAVYHYIAQLPAIMTQKQYDDFKAERLEARFTDNEGKENQCNVFDLVERAISYYLRRLQTEPSKPNPLKAIRKKYVSQPVKSEYIRSRWNLITGGGYYTIEDGSGRRSDTMTAEEWQEAITTPAMQKAISDMIATDGGGTEYTDAIVSRRRINRAKAIFSGMTEADADKAQDREDCEAGLVTPVKWHFYAEAPADLVKWDVIERGILSELYPADLDGSGDEDSEENFTRSMQDFVTEFRELVTAVLSDIDKLIYSGEAHLTNLPIEEWGRTCFSLRDLYNGNLYGERAEAEAEISIFAGNRRALLNGIAILRANDHRGHIDSKGYYEEPDISLALSHSSLEAFFPEAEDYADNVDIVETGRRTLTESYYLLKGYNYALELIGRYFDIPEITVFQMDIEGIEDKIRDFNNLVPVLYARIMDTDYQDSELKAKKLQVLKDHFQPIDYEAITIPAENKAQAEELLTGFRAFQPEYADTFNALLCIYQWGKDGEGAD